MIRDAIEKDREELYSLYKSSFSVKNAQSIDSFFDNGMKDGKVIICEKDDKIVASVFMNDMNVVFNNKLLKSTFLSHVAIHPDYRKTGAIDECMNSVLEECERKTLFTFVEANSFKFWENYGFQEACTHRFYELDHRYFEDIGTQGIYEDATVEECKFIYDTFVKHFDGYKKRTYHDFEMMFNECQTANERILVARHDNKPMGYIRFVLEGKHIKVREIIYLSSNALMRLCKVALGQRESILLELSDAERIEKMFALAIPRKRVAVMVRCNNFPLFNKLYNCKVKTSKDAYALSKKPKYMNEKY